MNRQNAPSVHPSSASYWALLCGCTALSLAPVWIVRYLPLVDYPNHLARMVILRDLSCSPFFQQFFVRVPFVPNLAMEMVVLPLLRWVNVIAAGKIFLSLGIIIFAVALHRLGSRASGGYNWLVPSAIFLFYNSLFFYGFVNYMFGVSMFLLTFDAWLGYCYHFSLKRLAWVAILAIGCLVAHISSFFLLGAAVGTTLVWQFTTKGFRLRPAVLLALPFVPVVAAWILLRPKGGAYSGLVLWGTPGMKLIHALVAVTTYNYRFDAGVAAILGVLAALAVWRGRPTFSQPLATIAIAFFVAFLLVPTASFGGSDADTRLIYPAFVFLLLSVRFRFSGRWGSVLLAMLLTVQTVRMVTIVRSWQEGDRLERRQLALIDSIPVHSRIFPIHVHSADMEQDKRERNLVHGICLATVERGAFVASLFGAAGQHIVVQRRTNGLGAVAGADELPKMDWNRVFGDYDYIWSFRLNEPYRSFLDGRLELAAADGPMRLYRIPHDVPITDHAIPVDNCPNDR